MNMKNTQCGNSEEQMCKQCMLFYGSETFQGLCSGCNKKKGVVKKEEIDLKSSLTETSITCPSRKATADQIKEQIVEPIEQAQKDRKRCYDCKKKTGLLGVQCKCGFVYCNSHRLPEQHSCTFNHLEAGKKKLQKQIIKVYNGKIAEI